MFFLAIADAAGQPQCSYEGCDPCFVRVLDERTLAFPNYDGNGMYLSLGNVLVNPHVGLLLIDFVAERPSRMRIERTASIAEHDELAWEHPARSSSSGCRCGACVRTARATSTAWRSSSARPVPRAVARSPAAY